MGVFSAQVTGPGTDSAGHLRRASAWLTDPVVASPAGPSASTGKGPTVATPHRDPSRSRPDSLHVGIDAEKVVVGPYPLRMRTGRGRRHRSGSITEVVPAPPSGRTRDDRVRFTSQLALALLLLSAVLHGVGFAWWLAPPVSAAVLGFVTWDQARRAATGTIAVPRVPAGDQTLHVLYARDERVAFERTFAAAKRARDTWPALRHMIDPADAEPMLARALADLAGVLARRQQLRRLRTDLAAVRHAGLPADSPAVQALVAQRQRLETLWREAGDEANRHILNINAAAVAGENLIREQRIGQTAREAERAIAHLTAAAMSRPSAEAAGVAGGRELADRTQAVIGAYRELAARYGRGV